MMTLSFCGTISLLLLSVSSIQIDQSVPDFNEISERIKKHNLHPRRALWGIDSCPSDFYQHGNSCCKTGTTLCCRMDGEGCYCRQGQILRQGNRGKPDGCGSQLTGWGDIQQAFFSEPGMKEACDKHDWCYTDCSKTHKQCDDEWYNAADQVCWDLYWNPLTSPVAAWDWLFGLNSGKGQCHGKVQAAYDYMSSYSAWMSSIGDSCSCDDSGKTYESIYKGCFKDDSARDLKVYIGRMGRSYPKRTCMNRCINYKYFSLQDGGNSRGPACFCSNDIKSNPGRYPQVADKECEVDRLGGGTLYGGGWRNAVYEITSRSPVSITALPSIGSYFGASLPSEWRPLAFQLQASINTWNSYLAFSQDEASGARNFAAALIIRNGSIRWNDIKDGRWGREVGIASSDIQLDSTFLLYGKLYSNHVEIYVNGPGVKTTFRFRNSLSVNFFMVTSGWSIHSVSIRDIAA